MAELRRFSASETADVFRRWKAGYSCRDIGRQMGRKAASVWVLLVPYGGITPVPRRRAASTLTLTEREEISRGLARDVSIRQIAVGLGRAPSTVSREVRRHGGRARYRAADADCRAWQWRRRPKRCRFATHPAA